MNKQLYEMIYKRKSFHLFQKTGDGKISPQELMQIQEMFETLTPLYKDIKVKMQIVPADKTSCKRGQEYCILLYSEKKSQYLQNIGYIGEQLDLYLVSKDIGTLWFGIGKAQEATYHNLDFVIMIAIKKVESDKFRKDMLKSKRKHIEEVWNGSPLGNIAQIVRYAPSACNSQPWFIEHHQNSISVFRYKKAGKRGIMPTHKVTYYNQIDIGIFLLFLELCLQHEVISYDRTTYEDMGGEEEKTLIAVYQMHN